MINPLFISTEVPWQDIKGKILEELLYWLFDSMGAKELEWRIGGKGSGTADQGRDLELSFYVASPDGDMIKQKWWVEAKGRSGTVEPIEVHEAVLNAAGKPDIDVLVIATNTAFSNPTRDWVKEWRSTHKRPMVKLWERTELERFCSKNPIAVIRMFSSALSPQGKLEVCKAKFWEYANLTDDPMLEILWKDFGELALDSQSLLALVTSELANGDICYRSWGMFVDKDLILGALVNGLLNVPYLIFRFNQKGTKEEPLIRGLTYLILVSLYRLGTSVTHEILTKSWEYTEDIKLSDGLQKFVLEPILNTLCDEVHDVCISECDRISGENIILTDEDVERYWERLSNSNKKARKQKSLLGLEALDVPCKVGFDLSKDNSCPICGKDKPEENIKRILSVINAIVDYRLKDGQANE